MTAGTGNGDEPTTGPRWTLGDAALPDEAEGVRWADGTVECRFRLRHPDGSVAAARGDVGVLLLGRPVDCTVCTSACSS